MLVTDEVSPQLWICSCQDILWTICSSQIWICCPCQDLLWWICSYGHAPPSYGYAPPSYGYDPARTSYGGYALMDMLLSAMVMLLPEPTLVDARSLTGGYA